VSLELVPGSLVNRYLDESLSGRQCSFCAKRPDETLCAFIEAEGYVRICEECVQTFHDFLDDDSSLRQT
jgi:hypothetical protein